MKIIAISDTHRQHDDLTGRLPDGDLLIHAGDLTGVGRREEVENVLKWLWLQANRYTHGVVFICGNHDLSFDPKFNHKDGRARKPEWLINSLAEIQSEGRVHYLENSGVEIDGLKFWGSPITPWFHGDRWGFNKHRGPDIKEIWNKIPLGTDVVITHGPAAYMGDFTIYDKQYVGCQDLRRVLKDIKPMLHVAGHIHEGYGYSYDECTTFVNASSCDIHYSVSNKPWEIIINKAEREVSISNGDLDTQ